MTEKKEPIVLALHQTAAPGTCGSCKFFVRRSIEATYVDRRYTDIPADKQGYCKFCFPPNRIYARQEWDGNSPPLDTVQDFDGCDLWQSSGETYIVSMVQP